MNRIMAVISAVFFLISAPLMSAAIKPQAGLAYTDPGSGAMIIQLLTTFGLMAAFYFSRARHWVAKRLGLESETEQSSADTLDSNHKADNQQ